MGEIVNKVRALALALGAPGLFLVAFLDSSFLPLPGITDVLFVITVVRTPGLMLLYVAITVVGSVAGCLVLHYLGRKGGEALVRKRFAGERIEHAMGKRVIWPEAIGTGGGAGPDRQDLDRAAGIDRRLQRRQWFRRRDKLRCNVAGLRVR